MSLLSLRALEPPHDEASFGDPAGATWDAPGQRPAVHQALGLGFRVQIRVPLKDFCRVQGCSAGCAVLVSLK